jgi:hypothetical protein
MISMHLNQYLEGYLPSFFLMINFKLGLNFVLPYLNPLKYYLSYEFAFFLPIANFSHRLGHPEQIKISNLLSIL